MSEIGIQNPFAPPRALVEDQIQATEELVPATRGARLLAVIVDASPGLVIGAAAGVFVALNPGLLMGGRPEHLASLGILAILAGIGFLAWAILSLVSVYRYGQTLGKRALGIRVVRTDGSRVTLWRFILLRWLPLAIVGWIVMVVGKHHPFLSYLITLVDSLLIFRASRLCLHDDIADTQVVTAASSPRATLAGSSGDDLPTIHF